MNLDQLRTLDAIVSQGGFRKAASSLNKAQSAVSYNIRILEEELGFPVFSRGGYRKQLTERGRAIHRKAQSLLLGMEELEGLGKELNSEVEPLLRLDITSICPLGLAVDALRQIGEEFPRTRLKVSMEILGGESLVLAEHVDLALADVVQHHRDLEMLPWRRLPFVPVAAPNHPLGQAAEPLTRAELINYVQIIISNRTEALAETRAGVEGDLNWTVADFATKRHMLVAGLGWGYMPHELVSDDLQGGRLVKLQFRDLAEECASLFLVRKRQRVHGPVAQRLWEVFANLSQPHESRHEDGQGKG